MKRKKNLIQIPNSKSWKNPGQCVFFDSVCSFFFRCSETMVEIYYYYFFIVLVKVQFGF